MRALGIALLALAIVSVVLPFGSITAKASDSDTLVGRWQGVDESEGGYITLWFNSDGTGRYLWEQIDASGVEDSDFEWLISTGMFRIKYTGQYNYSAYGYDLDGEDDLWLGNFDMWFERYGNDDFLGGVNCCCCLGFVGTPTLALAALSLIVPRYPRQAIYRNLPE